jgi:hypothetical protein
LSSYDRNLLLCDVKTKYSQYWNETIRALVVHLQSIRRLYGSFMARWKAICVRVLLAPYLAASQKLLKAAKASLRLGLGYFL